MKNVLRAGSFLLLATICEGKQCCSYTIDEVNRRALSLELLCNQIKDQSETILDGCCDRGVRGGRDVDCACAPTSITGGASPIVLSAPGSYCLDADLPTTEINPQPGVVLDLNGHTVLNVFGSNNFTVKNGIILSQLAGLKNIVAYRVQVPIVTAGSGDSNITLIDVTGIEHLQQIQHLLMVRCSDGAAGSDVLVGAQEVIMYDSSFKNELMFNEDSTLLNRLQIYQSQLAGGINESFDEGLTTSLQEVLLYKSIFDHLYLTSESAFTVRMIIEACDVGDMELGLASGPQRSFSGLITRSVMGNALCKQCKGLTFSASQATEEISFDTCEAIECDNVSVNREEGSCFIVDGGRSIVLRDCFATTGTAAASSDAGFSFNGTVTAIEVLTCCAKSCPVGFYANNGTDGFIGVIKECMADGCSQSSFALSNAQTNLFAYGNVALSSAGVPANNYNTAFNPVISGLTAIETDTVTSWRNISFELP